MKHDPKICKMMQKLSDALEMYHNKLPNNTPLFAVFINTDGTPEIVTPFDIDTEQLRKLFELLGQEKPERKVHLQNEN